MDLAKLKTELTTDPLSRGYGSMSDEEASVSLNAPTRQPNRASISGGELAANAVKSEFVALSANDRAYFNMLVLAATLPSTPTLRTELATLFPAGSGTRANLVALIKRPGSRADELDLGGVVTPSHVADARRL